MKWYIDSEMSCCCCRCGNNEVGPLSRKHPIVLVGDFNCNARTNPHNGVDDSDE